MCSKTHKIVWKVFGRCIHGTCHTSMPAHTTKKAAQNKGYQAQPAQFIPIFESCVKDATYSRIARQEEYERGDQKWSWAPRVNNFPQNRAAHVHPN